jgi:hypothetical protein
MQPKVKLLVAVFIGVLVVSFGVWKFVPHAPKSVAAAPATPAPAVKPLEGMPMGDHMWMIELQPLKPGDQARADAILAAAKAYTEKYTDFHNAEKAGLFPIMPGVDQPSYHFGRIGNDRVVAREHFNPSYPSALIYEKTTPGVRNSKYKVVGVMYTAPPASTPEQLDQMIPVSVTHWHQHVNFCSPPKGYKDPNWMINDPKFGFYGSIKTLEDCTANKGTFTAKSEFETHIYPFHTDPKDIWSSSMSDHGGTGMVDKPGAPKMDDMKDMKMDPNMKM